MDVCVWHKISEQTNQLEYKKKLSEINVETREAKAIEQEFWAVSWLLLYFIPTRDRVPALHAVAEGYKEQYKRDGYFANNILPAFADSDAFKKRTSPFEIEVAEIIHAQESGNKDKPKSKDVAR